MRVFYGKLFFWAIVLFLLPVAMAAARPIYPVAGQTERTLSVPPPPSRVVSLAPSLTEIAFAVGGGAQLVGRTRFSDFPPEATSLPVVGTYVRLDVEKIAALRPDLCLAVRDGTPLSTVQILKRLGISVLAAENDSLASVMETILAVGEKLGHPDRAQEIVGDMRKRIDAVARRGKTLSPKPEVFYQINAHPIISAGKGTYIHELITLAGGENLAGDRFGYPRYTIEQALALAPEVILIPSMDRSGAADVMIRDWRVWPHVPAVRDGRLVRVDSDLFDRPSPRLVQGLEQLVDIFQNQ